MKYEIDMTIVDLAKWYKNWMARKKIAEELGCTNEEGLATMTCCLVHQGLANESTAMELRGYQIHPPKEGQDVLSKSWWQGFGITI